MAEEYSIYSAFDASKHKAKYTNYLEVLIKEDGTVVYAVPSHQEKAAAIACEKLGLTRTELDGICPKEYYFDYLNWLLMMSNAVAVWNDGVIAPKVNKKQILALKSLKINGLYRGKVPKEVCSYNVTQTD